MLLESGPNHKIIASTQDPDGYYYNPCIKCSITIGSDTIYVENKFLIRANPVDCAAEIKEVKPFNNPPIIPMNQ